jgi:hypothetical protein
VKEEIHFNDAASLYFTVEAISAKSDLLEDSGFLEVIARPRWRFESDVETYCCGPECVILEADGDLYWNGTGGTGGASERLPKK